MSKSETLAEKIASILESEVQSPDLALLYASIEKIGHRLDKVEAALDPPPQLSNPQLSHPSLQKFAVAEAIADEIFSGLQKERPARSNRTASLVIIARCAARAASKQLPICVGRCCRCSRCLIAAKGIRVAYGGNSS